MDTETLNSHLHKLMIDTSEELLKIHFDQPGERKTRLRFPEYRHGSTRISEQELRFVMTHLLAPEFNYSIETPTMEKYSFSEKGERSAASDLSFYHNSEKVLNLELKAHNPGKKAIDKDIEKLIREDCAGAWVHILVSERDGSVGALFRKFKSAFENQKIKSSRKPLSFYVLILSSGTLLSRKAKENESDYSDNIFNINYNLWNNLKAGKYHCSNGEIVDEEHLEKDWQIEKFKIS